MSDYIKREQAAQAFIDWAAKREIFGSLEYAEELEKIPAADVKPVVRGKWIEKEVEVCRVRFYTGENENGETHTIRVVEKGKEKEQRCPYCGAQADVFWQNYCPSCGADMREKTMKELDYIRSMLSDRELLEQLAEEAAELGQAALKLIRATGVTRNPTPVDVGEASLALEEEFEDVVAAMSAFLCGYEGTWKLVDHSKKRSKWQRWANRVRKGEEKREHQMQQD